MLNVLDANLSHSIQSQYSITSLESAFREVVANSVEAGAAKVTCSVDFASYSFMVTDNGCGIAKDDLCKLGSGPASSKDSASMEHRGSALHYLKHVSDLTIISKQTQNPVYIAHFTDAKVQSLDLAHGYKDPVFGFVPMSAIESHGSVTIVRCLFARLPVRQSSLMRCSQNVQIHNLKNELLDCVVFKPDIALSLELKSKDTPVARQCVTLHPRLKNSNTAYIPHCLNALFNLGDQFERVDFAAHGSEFTGYLGTKLVVSGNYQFVYYHDRRFYISHTCQQRISRLVSKYAAFGEKSSGKHLVYFINIHNKDELDNVQGVDKKVHRIADQANVENALVENLERFLSSWKEGLSVPKPAKMRKPKSVSRSNSANLTQRLELPFSSQSLNTMQVSHKIDFSSHFNNVRDFKLDKHEIDQFRFIAQVDSKFLLIKADLLPARGDLKSTILLILDQHACDERIRVEQLFRDFIEEILLICHNVCDENPLDCSIQLSDSEYDLVSSAKAELAVWGIDIHCQAGTVKITKLPSILQHWSNPDKQSLVKDLLLTYGTVIETTDFSPLHNMVRSCTLDNIDELIDSWWKFLPYMPEPIVELLKSKACRSAIMFGTKLSSEVCLELIAKLKQCHSPFKCAHGRPSMVPIADLGDSTQAEL